MKFFNQKHISLRLSLALAFSLVVATSSIGVGVSTYLVAKNYFRSQLADQIKGLAQTAATLIDVETHSRILTPEDEEGPDYKKIQSWLQTFKAANPEIRFIYTMRKTDKGNTFIVDAEKDPSLVSHVGDVYEDEVPTLEMAFANPGSVYVEEKFTTDKWGSFRSGFAPIIDKNGNLEAVLGVDIDAHNILSSEARIRNLIAICSIITLFIALGASLILARNLSSSLSIVMNDVKKIQSLNLEKTTTEKSIISEITHLNDAMDGMKKALRSFKKFVPSEIVVDLLTVKQEAALGTNKKQLTIMFTDIADFTNISEKLSADDLSKNMSQYLDIVAAVIKSKTGTLDKFIGDAVMAFWGAPRECPEHALRACEAALECKARIDALNEKLEAKGFPRFHTRFGINTGEAIVGNMGTDTRMSFTAIGDSVNLASRVELLNKNYATEILVCESTYHLVADKFLFRKIDQTVVKGKSAPLKVYQLVEHKSQASEDLTVRVEQFNSGMDLLFAGEFEKAKSIFKILGANVIKDPVLENAMSRLEALVADQQQDSSRSFNPTILQYKN